MDEFVRKAAGMGLPAVLLTIVMGTTGLTGAAAITAALAMLGPGGMIGGIVLLGIIGLAADALTKYGFDEVIQGIYKERLKQGESLDALIQEIQKLPFSGDLKHKVIGALTLLSRDLDT